jgi:hypothetical protein
VLAAFDEWGELRSVELALKEEIKTLLRLEFRAGSGLSCDHSPPSDEMLE